MVSASPSLNMVDYIIKLLALLPVTWFGFHHSPKETTDSISQTPHRNISYYYPTVKSSLRSSCSYSAVKKSISSSS
jgi:hypothetical protein